MGKKSFYKNRVKSFMKNNRMVMAAVIGAAAGVLITRVMGSDRAKEMLSSVGGNIKDLSQKLMSEAVLKMEKAS